MDERVQTRAKLPSRACESCRVAKIRCQPSDQAGICKRCCDFKKECVFRARPRTRRPKAAQGDTPLPQPPGPSQTFSIDFSLPVEAELGLNLDDLLEKHDQFVDDLVPSATEEDFENDSAMASVSSSGGGATFSSISSPGSSSAGIANSISLTSMGIKPQFNLDSAQKLLDGFQDMLAFCPLVILPEGANVKSMAAESPFILLAILTATSCSGSLQGFNLYDDEFRKVLGVKFVTSGERSLELLQGLLIYNAWYPFHLRPNDRRTFQYLRMAVDIVHDLGLDEEATFANRLDSGVEPEDLDRLRTLVATYYLTSVKLRIWGKPIMLPKTSWISTCCDLVEKWSDKHQDHVLVWLCRLQCVCDGLAELRTSHNRDPTGHNRHHLNLVYLGLEAQLRDWQAKMPVSVSTLPTVRMFSLYAGINVAACPIMTPQRSKFGKATTMPADPVRLMGAVHLLGAFFDQVLTLTTSELDRLSAMEWGQLIMSVALGLRLSFPVDECPLFDAAQARSSLQLGSYLEKMCADPLPPENGADNKSKNKIAAAFRIIIRKIKAKYDRGVATEEMRALRGCPFLDGSLTDYIPLWEGQTSDGNYSSFSGSSALFSQAAAPKYNNLTGETSGTIGAMGMTGAASSSQLDTPMFHDLWATMTQGWAADDNVPNLGMGDDNAGDFGQF